MTPLLHCRRKCADIFDCNYVYYLLLRRSSNLLCIERLLLIAERYVLIVEESYTSSRTILPHGASFRGDPLSLFCTCESPKMDFNIKVKSSMAHLYLYFCTGFYALLIVLRSIFQLGSTLFLLQNNRGRLEKSQVILAFLTFSHFRCVRKQVVFPV